MQKRNGRSCGKVSVRLIKWSVCYYNPEPSTASGIFPNWYFMLLSVFVDFNGGSAKATAVMTCCPFFFFFFFLYPSADGEKYTSTYFHTRRVVLSSFLFCTLIFVTTGNYAGIFFLFFVLFLSVKQQLSSSCFCPCNSSYLLHVVLSVQQVSVPLQHACCSSGNCSLSFPFRPSCITFFRTPVVHFALFSFSIFFFLLFFFCFSFFSRSGLFCCVLAIGTLALHLLYLDELRLFGLLCFTAVCDHTNCISLG